MSRGLGDVYKRQNQGVDLSTVKSRYYAMVKRVRKEWDYLE